MIDISFTGGSVYIESGFINTNITEFSDEGSPIVCSDIEVTGNAVSLNGQLITWTKPNAYAVSVTVIPGTENDTSLNYLLEACHIHPTDDDSRTVKAINIENAKVKMTIMSPIADGAGTRYLKYVFTNGRILNGPAGPSTNSEGKMSARTYTFIFEKMIRSGNTGLKVNMKVTGDNY